MAKMVAMLSLGAFQSVWFTDPDGMLGEVVLIVDHDLTVVHAPEPLATP